MFTLGKKRQCTWGHCGKGIHPIGVVPVGAEQQQGKHPTDELLSE